MFEIKIKHCSCKILCQTLHLKCKRLHFNEKKALLSSAKMEK